MADRAELETPHGQRVMGALLFQDLAVVPLLVLIPALGQVSEGNLWSILGLAMLKATVLVVVLLWVVAWLAVPPIVKSQAEQRLGALLGRDVSIGRIDFAPWSLTLTVERLQIASAAGSVRKEPQFALERVLINADLRSC